MASPFGPEEGAVLVAVERANGGELAPLEQVLWTLASVAPPASRPDPAQFAESVTLLIELGVVEYVEDQLGLTVEGRKLLRRSGLSNDPRHVTHVTRLLQDLDEEDIGQLETLEPPPAPTEDDVRRALSDGEMIEGTPGGIGTPSLGEDVASTLGAGEVFGSRWVPAVPPGDSSADEAPPLPPGHDEAPAHPFLSRLFGRPKPDR